MPDQDWILEVVACPVCQAKLQRDPSHGPQEGTVRCVACGHCARYAGRRYYLQPPELDAAQQSENTFRQKVLADWAEELKPLGERRIAQVRLLNILTSYWITSQYFFFRDHFAKRYELRGRGLEIGAGAGAASAFIKLFFPKTQMVASDVAHVNIELAEELAASLGFDTDYFVACDAERLPFITDAFDFLFSSAVLHHLGDLPSAIRQAHRVLRAGGLWYAMSEISMGVLPRRLWLSRFGEQGKVTREWGIRETNYPYRQWRAFFEQGGFLMREVFFHRDPAHKLLSWSHALYYQMASRLPEFVFKAGMPSEVCFVLEKVQGT